MSQTKRYHLSVHADQFPVDLYLYDVSCDSCPKIWTISLPAHFLCSVFSVVMCTNTELDSLFKSHFFTSFKRLNVLISSSFYNAVFLLQVFCFF